MDTFDKYLIIACTIVWHAIKHTSETIKNNIKLVKLEHIKLLHTKQLNIA